MYTTEFYENVKVTKPILLLSSFGGYISVLYKDKGTSSVLPVYKLSMGINFSVTGRRGKKRLIACL